MMHMLNIGLEDLISELIVFVRKHQHEAKHKTFQEWSDLQMRNCFRSAMLNKCLFFCKNQAGEVVGLVHGEYDKLTNVFYVSNILVIERGVIQSFLEFGEQFYPNYTLHGHRYGKLVKYKTNRLKQKLLKHRSRI